MKSVVFDLMCKVALICMGNGILSWALVILLYYIENLTYIFSQA